MTAELGEPTGDDWGTPAWIVAFAAKLWGAVDLDVAAAAWNAKARRFFTRELDALAQPWSCRHAWLNPPYSIPNLPDFTGRARHEVLGGVAGGVTLLVPHDTSTQWWRQLIAPHGPQLRSSYVVGDQPEPFAHRLQLVSAGLTADVFPIGSRVQHVPHPKYRGTVETARFPSALVHLERTAA